MISAAKTPHLSQGRSDKKGYETKELINALDMSAIRNKRQDVLALLEEALGVVMA